MRIEVLTISGCPHRVLATARVREALDRSGLDAAVVERVVDDAAAVATSGMAGSPTILLDGRDLFASAAAQPSLSCRLYCSEAGVEGAPTVPALTDALTSRITA
jgi:hypothetical protein